jgi:hypothetical protein
MEPQDPLWLFPDRTDPEPEVSCLDCGTPVPYLESFQMSPDLKYFCQPCFDRRVAEALVSKEIP